MENAAVYVQTNDAEANEVIAFRRDAEGKLEPLGRYATGGRGTGKPHLASQSSVVLAGDTLLVANAGSDDLSVFVASADGLELADRVASGGAAPTSIAVHGRFVYALNNGTPSISGFVLEGRKLTPIEGATLPLSGDDADPAQIAFSRDGRTLVVTERGTNSISAYSVEVNGRAQGPQTIPSSGETPYGFDFAADAVVVTEAFGGEKGKAAASSYALSGPAKLEPVSGSVGDTRSEVCWAVTTRDGRFAYVTNFGDGTISSYRIGDDGSIELHEPVAASTREGEAGIRDEALSRDGRYLYAIDADAQKVHGWSVGSDGALRPVAEVGGVPATVAGLAAS
jgi:6-phosphogluconolactonase (cycloisomerase 2 family)